MTEDAVEGKGKFSLRRIFGLPKKEVSPKQVENAERRGGTAVSSKDFDAPTFMRKQQRNPEELPEHQPSPDKISKN
jgi:hypothetical protein